MNSSKCHVCHRGAQNNLYTEPEAELPSWSDQVGVPQQARFYDRSTQTPVVGTGEIEYAGYPHSAASPDQDVSPPLTNLESEVATSPLTPVELPLDPAGSVPNSAGNRGWWRGVIEYALNICCMIWTLFRRS